MTESHTTIPNAAGAISSSSLDPQVLEAVVEAAVTVQYDTDEIVFLESEPAAGLYIVQAGWLKAIKYSVDGREQVLSFLGEGEIINAISVFADTPNPATVVALEPTTLLLVKKETVLTLLEEHPKLARAVIHQLANRMLHLVSLVEDLSLHTVESRLARFLLQEADGNVVHRRPWTTQAELAHRLGTVTDVLNRVLRSLSDDGIIEVQRRQITILNRAGLEAKRDV